MKKLKCVVVEDRRDNTEVNSFVGLNGNGVHVAVMKINENTSTSIMNSAMENHRQW